MDLLDYTDTRGVRYETAFAVKIGLPIRRHSGIMGVENPLSRLSSTKERDMSVQTLVAARYRSSRGFVVPVDHPEPYRINFLSKDYDTADAVTTGKEWRFVAPIAGDLPDPGERRSADASQRREWGIRDRPSGGNPQRRRCIVPGNPTGHPGLRSIRGRRNGSASGKGRSIVDRPDLPKRATGDSQRPSFHLGGDSSRRILSGGTFSNPLRS